jgi:hypothetical protein
MSVVVRWSETSPWGPSLEFLCLVKDMGGARALSEAAEAMDAPTKDDRLSSRDPLAAVAARFPGELLWRVVSEDYRPSADPDDPPWPVGAEAARDLRRADVARFNAIRGAAQSRRRERRKQGR